VRTATSTCRPFEAGFDAYVAGNQDAMAIAERRFRPEFAVAFDAWRATNPETATPWPGYSCRRSGRRTTPSANACVRLLVQRLLLESRLLVLRHIGRAARRSWQRALPGGYQLPLPGQGCAVRLIALSAAVLESPWCSSEPWPGCPRRAARESDRVEYQACLWIRRTEPDTSSCGATDWRRGTTGRARSRLGTAGSVRRSEG
jgi:hypothetical protein